MDILYSDKIIRIGDQANSLGNGFIILYGETAPLELQDYCYIVSKHSLKHAISVNDYLQIGTHFFQITAIGKKVNETFSSTGHMTIRFDGEVVPELSGSLHVERKKAKSIKVDDKIQIIKSK